MPNKSKLIQGGDGTAIEAGFVGERITTASAITTTVATNNNTDYDVNNASISLTQGVWRIFYSCFLYYATGTAIGNNGRLTVRVREGSNEVGETKSAVFCKTTAADSNTSGATVSCETIVSITSSKTYKLTLKRVDAIGTSPSSGLEVGAAQAATFFAVRIA